MFVFFPVLNIIGVATTEGTASSMMNVKRKLSDSLVFMFLIKPKKMRQVRKKKLSCLDKSLPVANWH